jgi:hypothetical protein
MRFLTLASGFLIGGGTVASAMPTCPSVVSCLAGAPAPTIGAGVPVALAAGVVLCSMMLVKLWRRS